MTDSAGSPPDTTQQAPPPRRKVVRSLLRASGSTAALVLVYYLLPLDHTAHWVALAILVIGLAGLIGLVTFQVRWIIASQFPGLQALEALATSVPLFLLLFASAYIVMAALSASNFSQPMTHTNALYFTVTVFATVGFGDITAKTEAARLVVTGQMIIDLMIIGLGARIILGAVTRGRQRRQPPGTGISQSRS
jgi:voltage-gated potassium channel